MSTYKMPKIDSYGQSGNATVKLGKINGKNAVQVKFEDGGTYTLSAKNCPDYVTNGKFVVQLSPDKSKITAMRPINGQLKVKVSRFVAKENEAPAPKTKDVNYKGESWSYQYFTVILEILAPEKYVGMEVPLTLRYNFGPYSQTIEGATREVAGLTSLKSKYTAMLQDWISETGIEQFGPIPYKDNILPALQKRVLKANKEFLVVMKNGWVESIIPPDVNDDDDWQEESVSVPQDDAKSTFDSDGDNDSDYESKWGSPNETVLDEDDNSSDDSPPWDDVEE